MNISNTKKDLPAIITDIVPKFGVAEGETDPQHIYSEHKNKYKK